MGLFSFRTRSWHGVYFPLKPCAFFEVFWGMNSGFNPTPHVAHSLRCMVYTLKGNDACIEVWVWWLHHCYIHWRPVLWNAGCNSAWKVLLSTLQVILLHLSTQQLLLLAEILYTLSPSRYMTEHLTLSLHRQHMQQAKGTFKDSTYVHACSFFHADGDNSWLL